MITSRSIILGQTALLKLMDQYPDDSDAAFVEIGVGPRSVDASLRQFLAPALTSLFENAENEIPPETQMGVSEAIFDWMRIGLAMGILTERLYTATMEAAVSPDTSDEVRQALSTGIKGAMAQEEATAELLDLAQEVATKLGQDIDVDTWGDSPEEIQEHANALFKSFLNDESMAGILARMMSNTPPDAEEADE